MNKQKWMATYDVSVWWNGAAYEALCKRFSYHGRYINATGESEDLALHELAYKMPVKGWED